jgi:N-acetylglucosamine kinase-like BadF-type ATPase
MTGVGGDMFKYDDIIIGVDGGGTRSTAAAFDMDGRFLARETLEASLNSNTIGFQAARENLCVLIGRLLKRCGEQSPKQCGECGYARLAVGSSALNRDADGAFTKRFCGGVFPVEKVTLLSDARAALTGAALGQPGMVVIAGTGALAYLRDAAGAEHTALGWGSLIGDPFSGYSLAIDGVRAALSYNEGNGGSARLLHDALCFFDTDAAGILDRLYNRDMDRRGIAAFGRFTLEAAWTYGDPAAMAIVDKHLNELAHSCASLLAQHTPGLGVYLHGGVFRNNPRAREEFYARLGVFSPGVHFRNTALPPEAGAALIAFAALGKSINVVSEVMMDTIPNDSMYTALRDGVDPAPLDNDDPVPHVTPPFYAGYGRADITPPIGTELAGYGYFLARKAERVQDALSVVAVYLHSGVERVIVISCDLLGLSRDVCGAVLESLAAQCGIALDHVMLVSVHTHTGPAIKYHTGCGEVSPEYVATLAPRILEACIGAIADAKPVLSLDYRKATIDGHVYNRSDNGGPVDRTARGFLIKRDNAPDIVIASHACHPVFSGRMSAVSPDYPGHVRRLFEADGQHCLYLNGACGDVDPIVPKGADRHALIQAYAESIYHAFRSQPRALPLSLSSKRASFQLRMINVDEGGIRAIVNRAVDTAAMSGQADVARAWGDFMLDKLNREGSLPDSESVETVCVTLGGIPIIALPFETFIITGINARAVLGEDVLTLGCLEEPLGYLPSRADVERGQYASFDAFFLYKRLPALAGEAERLGEFIGSAFADFAITNAASMGN